MYKNMITRECFVFQHLVKKVPKKLTILGTGVQAQTHLDALKRYYDFQEVSYKPKPVEYSSL